jgi:hypothetical protein
VECGYAEPELRLGLENMPIDVIKLFGPTLSSQMTIGDYQWLIRLGRVCTCLLVSIYTIFSQTSAIHHHLGAVIQPKSLTRFTNCSSLPLYGNNAINYENTLSWMTSLRKLSLCCVRDVHDYDVKKLTHILSLSLDCDDYVTNHGLVSLTQLMELSLDRNLQITNTAVMVLTNLTSLEICNSKITSTVFYHLTNISNLAIGGSECKYISYNQGIECLKLTRLCTISVASLENTHLSKMTDMRELVLRGMKHITWDGIKSMTSLKRLDYYSLEAGDSILENCTKLVYLSSEKGLL